MPDEYHWISTLPCIIGLVEKKITRKPHHDLHGKNPWFPDRKKRSRKSRVLLDLCQFMGRYHPAKQQNHHQPSKFQ